MSFASSSAGLPQPAAKFITLEGLDGAGKSTHLAWLQQWLSAQGQEALFTREPGGTPLGETLRQLVLTQSMHSRTEALMLFAARQELVLTQIQPALQAGRWVVSDRFVDASYAYQGGGRGLPVADLALLEQWVLGDFRPDLTLLLDVPESTSQERMQHRPRDRFEQEHSDFHARVRAAYLARAAAEPQRFLVLDATQSVAAIQSQIAQRLSLWLEPQPESRP